MNIDIDAPLNCVCCIFYNSINIVFTNILTLLVLQGSLIFSMSKSLWDEIDQSHLMTGRRRCANQIIFLLAKKIPQNLEDKR